jgi:hypothetical protein
MFVSGCDCISDAGYSLEKMCEMTGMELGLLEKDEKSINACDSIFGYAEAKTPTVCVNDGDAEIIGRYSVSRVCGFARKDFYDHVVYFSGIGNLSASVLRYVIKQAGVFIYAENDTPTFVNSNFIGVYNTRNENTTVFVKEDGEFTEIFSGKKYKSENGKVILPTGECPAQMLKLK